MFGQSTRSVDTILSPGTSMHFQVNSTYSQENARTLLTDYFPYNGINFSNFCTTYFPYRELLQKFTLKNLHNQSIHGVTFQFNKFTPYRTDSLLHELTDGLPTEKARALALYQFVANNHLYYYAPDNINPVFENYNAAKFLNTYGYGHCGMISTGLSHLADRLSGLDQRIWFIDGGNHGLSEIRTDSTLVCLDADQEGYYLLPDNKSLATFKDVLLDKYLYMRTKHFGKATPFNWEWNRHFNQFISNGFHFYTHTDTTLNIVEPCCPRINTRLGDDITFDLKPNSTITFFPDDTATINHFAQNHPYPSLSTVLRTIGWGMQDTDYKPFGTAISNGILNYSNIQVPAGDTVYTGLLDGLPSQIILREKTPFVMHNGSTEIHFTKQGSNDTLNIYFSRDSLNWIPILQNSNLPPGNHVFPLNLLSIIQPHQTAALYQFYIKIDFVTHGGNNGITIRKLTTGCNFQFNKQNGPRLTTGANTLELYASDNLSIQTTLNWQQDTLNHPPSNQFSPLFPANGMTVDSNYFTFKWLVPSDPDGDSIIDYQIMVGEEPEILYPIAGLFDRGLFLTNGGQPQFTPEIRDYLSPNRTYYWKVRAQDSKGLWGAWSPVWNFSVHGPAYPKNLRWEFAASGATQILKLHWDQNTNGSAASYYKIFCSNDRNGFYPSDTTRYTTCLTPYYLVHLKGIKARHRVVAYDAKGNSSSASYMVNTPSFYMGHTGVSFDYMQLLINQINQLAEPWPTVNIEDRNLFCLVNASQFQLSGTLLTPIDTGYMKADICTRIGTDTVRVFQLFLRVLPPGNTGSYHTGPSLLVSPRDTLVAPQNGLQLTGLRYEGFIHGDGINSLSTPAHVNHTIHAGSALGYHATTASGATSPTYTVIHQQGLAMVVGNPLTTNATEKVAETLRIHPNPADHYVTITTNRSNPEEFLAVTFYDMSGESMLHLPRYKSGEKISVHHLTKGTYAIRLSDQQGNLLGQSKLLKK